MFKRGLTLFLTLAIFLFAFSTAAFAEPGNNKGKNAIKVKVQFKGDGVHFKEDFKFKDMGSHWAVPQIRAMYMQGIINGYPDFSFRPENSVTKNEALLMICRAVGFDKDDYRAKNEWNNIPDWMQECIDFAIEEKIITKSEAKNFKGNTPAKRYEAAVWAAKAAGLNAYTDIKFADLQDIPYFARPYIGSMYQCRYMIGYPGNKFQPNKPIKRAEITTLIFNMLGDFDGVVNYRVVKGTVKDIDNDNVAVKTTYGSEKDYEITNDTEIFTNRFRANWDDVEEGAKVVLYLNSNNEVLYLYAWELDEVDDEDEEVLTVEKFVPKNDGKTKVAPSLKELQVKFNETIKAVTDLEDIAESIEIEAENDKAVKITPNIDEDDLEIDGAVLIIKVKLDYATEYTVTIDEGVIRAKDSREIKNDDIEWEFTTDDEKELVAEKFSPGKRAKDVARDITELKVKFNQDIEAVRSFERVKNGISIIEADDDTVIDVEDVKIIGDELIIKLDDEGNELDFATKYIVTIDEDVIRAEDSRNIKNDNIKWVFTTEEEDK